MGVCVYAYVRVCVLACICVCACVSLCMRVCMFVCVCMCVCVSVFPGCKFNLPQLGNQVNGNISMCCRLTRLWLSSA